MLVELVFGIHGKLSVEASVKRGRDFQFALRLDSGQFLVFVSPEDPKTISSEAFAKRRAKYGPVDLCGDAFRHGALVDSLEKAFRAAGTDRTAKAVVLQQWVAPGCGNIIANEGLHLARVDPTAKAASLGRAEADRLAYWLRAYAMRWYRDGNALQRYRLVDNRRPVDGCGECGLTREQGGLVQSSCTAMGRGVKGFACAACLAKPPRPRGDPLAEKPGRGAWPRPRAACRRRRRRRGATPAARRGPRAHVRRAAREAGTLRFLFFEVAPHVQVRRFGLQSPRPLRRALRAELADVPVRGDGDQHRHPAQRRGGHQQRHGRPRGRALLLVPAPPVLRAFLRRRPESPRQLGPPGGGPGAPQGGLRPHQAQEPAAPVLWKQEVEEAAREEVNTPST